MKRLLLAALAISMAASCQKESTAASPEGAGLVQLTSQGIATKVAGDEWQAGDGIGVFTDGMLYNDHSNIAYTAASDGAETAFSATDPIYWRAGQSADVTFTAYYPYSSSATAQSIPVDISAGEGAAEFLYASKTWSAADGTDSDIELIFEHKLAKVVLEITYSDSFEGLRATAPSASITDVPTTASYLVDGTLVEGSQGGNQDLTIQSSLNEVSAILLPGSYSSYIIFEIGSERYYVPYTKTLVAGTIYTHKLTFGQNEATLGEATIGDWVENNAASDLTPEAQIFQGAGSASDPYLLTSAAQLRQILSYPASHFKLEGDIDLGAEGWDISSFASFSGTIDGDYHTISGFSFDLSNISSVFWEIGLVPELAAEGQIKNLAIEGDISISSSLDQITTIGIFAGKNFGTITNCINKVNLAYSYSTNLTQLGGIAGENSGTIIYCRNMGALEANTTNLGGIAGVNSSSIDQCYNGTGGDLTLSADKSCGGIAGTNAGSLTRCYSNGNTISGSSSAYFAGIVGFNTGYICATYSASTVASGYGVVSMNTNSGYISYSYYKDDTALGVYKDNYSSSGGITDSESYSSADTLIYNLNKAYSPDYWSYVPSNVILKNITEY